MDVHRNKSKVLRYILKRDTLPSSVCRSSTKKIIDYSFRKPIGSFRKTFNGPKAKTCDRNSRVPFRTLSSD